MQILLEKIPLAPEILWDIGDTGFNVSDKMNIFLYSFGTNMYLLFFFFCHLLLTEVKIGYHDHK